MHNKPHTEQAKRNMRLARQAQPRKWDCLPELDIVERLLHTDATTRSIAKEYGCSASCTVRRVDCVGFELPDLAEMGEEELTTYGQGMKKMIEEVREAGE